MKKLILLGAMAIASASAFAGVFTSTRDISRGVSSDLSQERTINDHDQYFKAPAGLNYNNLKVKAYAECTASGTSTDGYDVYSTAAYYAAPDGDWDQRDYINMAYSFAGHMIDATPYQNVMPYLYGTTGNNSIIAYHNMYLPAGMYGTMRTVITFDATYIPAGF